MIIELLCTPIFWIIDFFIDLVPNNPNLPSWSVDFLNLLGKGLSFFPNDVFVVFVANVVFWSSIYLIDSIAVFILKKIPFLGIE